MPDYFMSKAFPSMAHIYGNVIANGCNFYKSLLPPNFFKTVHINSRMAMSYHLGKNRYNEEQFLHKPKPILNITCVPDLSHEPEYMNSMFNDMAVINTANDFSQAHILYDASKEIALDFSMKVIKVNFEFISCFETSLAQWNTANVINSMGYHDGAPMNVDLVLEIQLPKDIIVQIAKINNFVIDASGNIVDIENFIKYLNGHSSLPITYKLKTSTGHNEFFFIYKQKSIVRFDGKVDIDEGEAKGDIRENFKITDRMYIITYAPSFFYFFTKSEEFALIDVAIKSEDILQDYIIPVFNVDYNLLFTDSIDGWQKYFESGYGFDKDTEKEEFKLSDMLSANSNIFKVLDYQNRHGITNQFFKIVLIKDKAYATAEEFVVTFEPTDAKCTIYNGDPSSAYFIIVYADTQYINSILTKIIEE